MSGWDPQNQGLLNHFLIQVAQILINGDNIKFWQVGFMPGLERSFVSHSSISLPLYGGDEFGKV